ncbi:MAG: tetratricopeptide repeat protein [Pseudodesulfovibrio sp.]
MTASFITFGRRSVILVVVFSAAAMFVTSFVYRMNHPNLFVQVEHKREQTSAAPPGMGQAGGPMAKIKEYMARVDENPDDVEALVGLGNAFLMMRAWDRALIPLTRASELAPGDANVLKAVGIAYFNKKEFDKAAEAYLSILKDDPDDTLALFNLGIINKYYFKKVDEARTYFEKVLSLEKNDSEMLKMARQELES